MKLIRLQLNTPFRSLPEGFTINFLHEKDKEQAYDFNPWCMAGRNGAGKSNILEAVAAIFYHLECIYLDFKPDGFRNDEERDLSFNAFKSNPDAYELEYYISEPLELRDRLITMNLQSQPLTRLRIIKDLGKRPVVSRYVEVIESWQSLLRNQIKQILPEYIIGYSSGENEIISLPFLKMRFIHFDEYKERLIDEKGYSKPEARFVFADSSYSQAIFLANYLMQDEAFLDPFLDVLGIEKLDQFRIVIRTNESYVKNKKTGEIEQVNYFSSKYENDLVEKTYKDLVHEDEVLKYLLELVDKTIIPKLRNCSTSNYDDTDNEINYLDYSVNEETKKAFRFHFEDNPIELFQAFQILLTLNLFEVSTTTKQEIYQSDSLFANEMVPVLADERKVMRFDDLQITKKSVGKLLTKSLSDGEHQYLHAIGLCLLFKNTNSLFLLDEPETHLNPDWRSSFISVLRNSLEQKSEKQSDTFLNTPEEKYTSELLITSHSPFIISDCKRENVLVFSRDEETNEVVCNRPDFKTFGASVNLITIKIFGQQETIGDYARESLTALDRRLDSGEDPNGLIKEANDLLGDSVEKAMFINKALDMMDDSG
ncbi:MAG: restriction system-associated AAA family ATPase [Bacteroidota bacterium]